MKRIRIELVADLPDDAVEREMGKLVFSSKGDRLAAYLRVPGLKPAGASVEDSPMREA